MRVRRAGEQHPEEWRRDLNPEAMAGQNVGSEGPHPEQTARTAFDLKEIHERFRHFSDDDLKQIPILSRGTRLEQGATYIDLQDEHPQEFTATGEMEVGPYNWIVPKDAVDYQLWNRLRGVTNPERLGVASER